jgi:citronellol/citronellal dehydrogenase
MGDAAHAILTGDSRRVTGHFFLDDEVLRARGVTDFAAYRHPGVAESDLVGDFFV